MSEADNDERLPSQLSAWAAMFGIAWRAWPFGAAATILGWGVATIAAGPMLGIALRSVVEERGFADPVWIVAIAAGVVLPEVLLSLTDHVRDIIRRKGEQGISQRIMRATVRPLGIEHLESPRYADRMSFIRNEAALISTVFGDVAGQTGLVLAFGASLVLLASVSWWLLVPVGGALLLGVAQLRAGSWAAAIRESSTSEQRLAERMLRTATDPESAQDVRMLGIERWLLRSFDASTSRLVKRLLHAESRSFLIAGGGGAVQALMLTLGLGLLIWLSAKGQASPGDVVLGVVVLQTVLESARGLAASGAHIARVSYAARRYVWLQRYVSDVQVSAEPTAVPDRLTEGISLSGVSFRYPHTEHDVLHDITLRLPAGAVVALVGDNGAGKSTLVKLLCRYYDPTEGRITVDDADLREVDLDGWRAATSAGFQDFARFEFSGTESIGVGELEVLDTSRTPAELRRKRISSAAEAGDASSVLERLPDGYDTQLGRQFGGAQLSVGQWQRVAISRAFLRHRPLLTLLDEPTAALDPRAEHQQFVRFAEQAEQARERGAVTLLISHRFSTVNMADLIVVMSRGRIVETGTHHELISGETLYRRMYLAQAERYR